MAIHDAPEAPEAPFQRALSGVSRRSVLKGMAVVAGAAAVPTILAACSSAATAAPSGGGSAAVTGTVKIGSNHSDPGESKGMGLINTAFETANPGAKVVQNQVDHGTFQNQIGAYLQGTPDDAFTWFSGYRMRFFAAKGLATAIDDVWSKVSSNFTSAYATSVTGDDSKVYGVPVDYYPWAVFYRKSVWAAKGYTIPKTWDDLKTLATKMQATA